MSTQPDPKAMSSDRRLLLSGFWDSYGFDGDERLRRARTIYASSSAQLVDGLLLHDSVVIPSHDLLCIVPLIERLGTQRLGRLLESGALKLARVRRPLAYFSGKGLANFERPRQTGSFPESAPLDESVDSALRAWQTLSGLHPSNRLRRNLLASVEEMDLGRHTGNIRRSSHAVVLGSPELSRRIAGTEAHLGALGPSDGPLTAVIWAPPQYASGDPQIRGFLDVVQAVSETVVAAELNCGNISSLAHFESTLVAEQDWFRGQTGLAEQLFELRQIVGIPDIAALVASNTVDLNQICDLRESPAGESFRVWFHGAARSADTNSIARAYADICGDLAKASGITSRVIKLAVAGSSAALGSGAGAISKALGAIAQFAINHLRLGRSPVFFIDQLRHVAQPKGSSLSLEPLDKRR